MFSDIRGFNTFPKNSTQDLALFSSISLDMNRVRFMALMARLDKYIGDAVMPSGGRSRGSGPRYTRATPR